MFLMKEYHLLEMIMPQLVVMDIIQLQQVIKNILVKYLIQVRIKDFILNMF